MFTKHTYDSGKPGPHLLITDGVHGDEFESISAIHRIQTWIQDEIVHGVVTLVPVVNEAAFLRGHRTADDGLDLARTCPGNIDGSVTEQTAHELSELICSADYYIDLHTGGTRISVAPLAGYVLHPNMEVLEPTRQMARAFNLPIIWGTDWRLEGRSLSIARDANVPAIYCEYLGGAQCSIDGINAYENGCKNVMGWLDMIAHSQPDTLIEHFVEDPRPGAGHLQINNPAPFDGVFIASVSLGDSISAGEIYGTLTTMDGTKSVELIAETSGIVILLHTFPGVNTSDPLCVIMSAQG